MAPCQCMWHLYADFLNAPSGGMNQKRAPHGQRQSHKFGPWQIEDGLVFIPIDNTYLDTKSHIWMDICKSTKYSFDSSSPQLYEDMADILIPQMWKWHWTTRSMKASQLMSSGARMDFQPSSSSDGSDSFLGGGTGRSFLCYCIYCYGSSQMFCRISKG